MSKPIVVEIKENITGGEVFSYHLNIRRGEGHWWGMEVMNAAEMRKIAEVLLEKAKELENVSTPSPA